MRKSKFRLFSLVVITYLFSTTKITFAETIEIPNISNDYFTNNDVNDGNRSNVFLDDQGADGYGLFFIGNVIDNPTTLTISGGQEITCNKQLKGYYTNSFLNFQLFPIDDYTAGSTDVNYVAGGLFTDCSYGSKPYNGVYGHIFWRYGNSQRNTHEIRAGIGGSNRNSTSSLHLVEEDDSLGLEGYFQDSLGKTARVITDFVEKVLIKIPDAYFNSTTKALSSNRNEIYFNDAGNDGFGLFLLGTGIEGTYYVTDTGGNTLTCQGQINGYYSISFNDFGMLPLDATTASYKYKSNYNINFETGGWYYNCKNSSNQDYPGVYGYIRLRYNTGNVHELRAGIDNNGYFKTSSPLELIYPENLRNTNRVLSGHFQSSLGKNSTAVARLFGDLGFIVNGENIQAAGTTENPNYEISFESYRNATVYIKSSKKGASAKLVLTAFDINGQPHTYTDNITTMPAAMGNFRFYGYKEYSNILSTSLTQNEIVSGTINLTLNEGTKTRSKSVDFTINGSSDLPTTHVSYDPNCTKTGITVTATSSGSIEYAKVDGPSCSSTSNYTFTSYTNGISLTASDRNKYICFKSTYNGKVGYNYRKVQGFDLEGPIFTFENNQGYECEAGSLIIKDESDNGGCAGLPTNAYKFGNGTYGTNKTYNIAAQQPGVISVIGYVKDSLENEASQTATYTVNDAIPEANPFTVSNVGNSVKTITLAEFISNSSAHEGSCGTSALSFKEIQNNGSKGTCELSNNTLTYDPDDGQEGNDTCTIILEDNEHSTVAVVVTFAGINSVVPSITIDPITPAGCSKQKTITATSNGTLYRHKDTNISTVCSGSDWTLYTAPLVFNSSDDNGNYVCFKADNGGNINYGIATISNIDSSLPVVTTQYDSEVYECSVGTVTISATDDGCGSGTLTLTIDGQVVSSNRNGGAYAYEKEIGNNIGSTQLNISVTDGAGNVKTESVTFNSNPVNIAGNSFGVALTKNGNTYSYAGNRYSLINPSAGNCETISIVGTPTCSKGGTWTPQAGNTFTYTYVGTDTEDLYCTITLTDGDSNIDVIGNFYDCSSPGNLNCYPGLTPIFTEGGSKYISYEDIGLGKYTSGSDVKIKINGHGISTLSGYRYSCIEQPQDRYCKELERWTYPSSNNNYNTNLRTFISMFSNPEICKERASARSKRYTYKQERINGEDDIFEIDLIGAQGACNTMDIPYGSKNQGTRKVWIEIEDVNGYTSGASTDEIIYSTKAPIIEPYETKGSYTRFGEPKASTPTVNSTSVTTTISINSAELSHGTTGKNASQEGNLISYELLPGIIWFDNARKEWLVTHYNNE